MGIKSNGNGSISITRGWIAVILAGVSIVVSLGTVGISQLVGSAVMQQQVDMNKEDINALEVWGPKAGDRNTAEDSRKKWDRHNTYHNELKTLIVDEFTAVKLEIAGLK